MEIIPEEVGKVSRAWDEQHLDLVAAAGQIAGAPTNGFTAAVSGAASSFVSAWEGHATTAADLSEARADGLRATIADWLATDEGVSLEQALLLGYLRELR